MKTKIKGAKTIEEYTNRRIKAWLDEAFAPGSLDIEMLGGGVAKVTDGFGDKAYAVYRNGKVDLRTDMEGWV